MYELMWCILGVMVYRIFSAISGYNSLSPYVQEVYLLGIVFLSATIEDMLSVKKLKYKVLQQTSSVGEEEIKLLRLMDEQMIESWKQTSINRFVSVWPKRFQKDISHGDWNEIMDAVASKYKEEIWK